MKWILSILLLITALAQQTQDPLALLEIRLASIPLPNPSSYYGQNPSFVAQIENSYCDKALSQGRFLGKEGWIFSAEMDFGAET
ncbi:MAG: hypothetical protein R2880_03900 [Deinococcales bacterium]